MGFFEILIIAVVALLVVGPERMPEAVRTVALTLGRIKRSFDSARTEIEKQVGADDIRRQLHNEAIVDNLANLKKELSVADKKAEGENNTDHHDEPYDHDPHNNPDEDDFEDEQSYRDRHQHDHQYSHQDDEPEQSENKNASSI